MHNYFPEERLKKLLPALSPLARRIGKGNGTVPEEHVLQEILRNSKIPEEEWALQEMGFWSGKLQQAHNASSDVEKTAIIAELQDRGVPMAYAILAVEAAILKPVVFEQQSIDFGLLQPGEGANRTLPVSGQLLKVRVRNSRLKVTLLKRNSGDSLVKVQLLAGSAGESLHENIILQGEKVEMKVVVRAQWEKEIPILQYCPECKCKKKSLYWNKVYRRFECFNCKVEGPSLDKLAKP